MVDERDPDRETGELPDELRGMLSSPLPETGQTPPKRPGDDDSMLERIKDLLNRPLPGTPGYENLPGAGYSAGEWEAMKARHEREREALASRHAAERDLLQQHRERDREPGKVERERDKETEKRMREMEREARKREREQSKDERGRGRGRGPR